MAIEAEHYEESRLALTTNPIVVALAAEIEVGLRNGYVTIDELAYSDTLEPRFGFMMQANDEYNRRSGDEYHSGPRHIGAVAEAIIRILKEGAK